MELNKELATAKDLHKLSKEAIKAHQQMSIRLCKQGLAQLSPNLDEFVQNIGTKSETPRHVDAERLEGDINVDEILQREESMLGKLLDSVMNVKQQFGRQQENLQERIHEVEMTLKREKLKHSEEVGSLQKVIFLFLHVISSHS